MAQLSPEYALIFLTIIVVVIIIIFGFMFVSWRRSKNLKFPPVLPSEGLKVWAAASATIAKGGVPVRITFFEDRIEYRLLLKHTLYYSKITSVDYERKLMSTARLIKFNDGLFGIMPGSQDAAREILSFFKRKNVRLTEAAASFLGSR